MNEYEQKKRPRSSDRKRRMSDKEWGGGQKETAYNKARRKQLKAIRRDVSKNKFQAHLARHCHLHIAQAYNFKQLP